MSQELRETPDERVDYTLGQLAQKWATHMKSCRPKEYRAMSAMEKTETSQLMASATARLARNLMLTGMPDYEAWPAAISETILGVPAL